MTGVERLGDDWLLTAKGVEYAKSLFTEMINTRADKAATKKVVTIITEDDTVQSKEDKSAKTAKSKKEAANSGRGFQNLRKLTMPKKLKI